MKAITYKGEAPKIAVPPLDGEQIDKILAIISKQCDVLRELSCAFVLIPVATSVRSTDLSGEVPKDDT